MNVCGPCGLDFSSLRAFDAHCVGRHAFTYSEGLRMNPPREEGRRCLREDELHAAGFVQNSHGRWGLTAHMEHAHRRFSAQPGTSEAPRRAA